MLELHPEDLKKQWLHHKVGSRNSNKGGVSQALLLFKLSFGLFLYPLSAPFLNPLSSPFPHFQQFEEEDKEHRHLPLLVVHLPQGTEFPARFCSKVLQH